MTTAAQKHIKLALGLPLRLQTFFSRYPPASILPENANPKEFETAYQKVAPNPFQSTKHPITGKWHDPKYSLRRQAELVKLARNHGVEELLPFTVKGTEYRLSKRVELGLRVRGTGVGQQVKGHKHERQLGAKYVAALLLARLEVLVMFWVLTEIAGWRRGGRPCWKCRLSSGNGRRYVQFIPVSPLADDTDELNAGWQAELE